MTGPTIAARTAPVLKPLGTTAAGAGSSVTSVIESPGVRPRIRTIGTGHAVAITPLGPPRAVRRTGSVRSPPRTSGVRSTLIPVFRTVTTGTPVYTVTVVGPPVTPRASIPVAGPIPSIIPAVVLPEAVAPRAVVSRGAGPGTITALRVPAAVRAMVACAVGPTVTESAPVTVGSTALGSALVTVPCEPVVPIPSGAITAVRPVIPAP
jgi:hypothetical protein